MQRKEFEDHEKSCDFRVKTCEKCGFKLPKEDAGKAHECAEAIQKHFSEIEEVIIKLKNQLAVHEDELLKAKDSARKYIRYSFVLPELQVIDFNADLGWNQAIIANA